MNRSGVKQNIKKQDGLYFLTITIVEWVDVFIRKRYCETVLESLSFCIKNKGLNVYSYCIMSNHLHMVVSSEPSHDLKDVIRDFKKYTSRKIIEQIQSEPESRAKWMLEIFRKAGQNHSKVKNYKVWQDGNHAIELYSPRFTWIKVMYIHKNPVKAELVKKPEDWWYSSARNYLSMEAALDRVICIRPPMKRGY